MYNSGDAAEQIVRISLEGTEVALKLTGSAAKNIAAMIYTVLKNRDTAYDISARMARSLEQNKAPRHTEQER